MCIYNELIERRVNLCVVGLGYVGMPLAVEFANKFNVIGFDINKHKVDLYRDGIDCTNEVGSDAIKNSGVNFTSEEVNLDKAKFFVIAVPTPIHSDNTPDLQPLISVSEIVGKHLKRGDYVVYESTVSPGITEDICRPILEEMSGLMCGQDFKIGYSPERINPGDQVHRLKNTVKIVSGIDKESLEEISKVYSSILENGVYKAENIKIAEAAKIIENSQRDVNIAFMNEISVIFNKMGIETSKVLEAAQTKWNFQPFKPGLVGGHCIGVDPYYLIYASERKGYKPELLMASRKINDGMGEFIAQLVIKKMIKNNINISNAKVGILGFAFKENCPDIRNTKVYSIIKALQEYEINVVVADDYVDKDEVEESYGVKIIPENDVNDLDVLVLAVLHDKYLKYDEQELANKFKDDSNNRLLIDVKGIFRDDERIKEKFNCCSL
ncbi:MAG: nucleotide sugar dehydrogenase [Clostridium sp.]|nr:nucleotide sugar dehydrogenase [Clostridium sp.]